MSGKLRLWYWRWRWRRQRKNPFFIGKLGECLAEEFLGKKGYRCILRNWRSPRDRRDEIDLICMDGRILVFVEVKTQSREFPVPAFYRVDRRKRAVLLRAARTYLQGLKTKPLTFRLDVVEVTLRQSADADILHFENMGFSGSGLLR